MRSALKLALITLSVPLIAACGQQGPMSLAPSTTTFLAANRVSYSLTARTGEPASLIVMARASVFMPKTISVLANADYMGRATLTVGPRFCDYVNAGFSTYVRLDGACNTFTPDEAVEVEAGDGVSLSLQVSPEVPVSLQAIVTGEAL